MKQLQDKIFNVRAARWDVGSFSKMSGNEKKEVEAIMVVREVLYLNKLGSTSRSLGFPSAALDFGATSRATGHNYATGMVLHPAILVPTVHQLSLL